MNKQAQTKLLASNALIWAIATVMSFVLPLVSDSLTEGRSGFLRMFLHVGVLIVGMKASHSNISKAIGPPTDGV